ncbi:MAG: hypothetical protein OSJ27_05840 [Candidatus Gastranaerophilales bacterium]|nr:hypothetical protein [Candidatus Gastranaerophilales bacterium]
MDLGTKNANDLISKNFEAAKSAAKAVVDTADVETFEKLTQKSEFIFDFIKEKIIKNLCCAVTKENLSNILKFTKIYSSDFEDFIVNSWVKFANEDLTDEILTLFEQGTEEQKAYAAAYFYHINDPLAVEFLEKYAFSDFDPLAQNCAAALCSFKDKKLYNEAISVLQNAVSNSEEDFENYKYVNFLVSYGDKSAFDVLFEYFKNTSVKGFAASSILYLTNLFELADTGKLKEALCIFDNILSAYPEEISLETVFDFEILRFIKYLCKTVKDGVPQGISDIAPSYIKRIILKAKYKFNLISREDIYTFDLPKDVKKEITAISEYINALDIPLFDGLEEELCTKDRERILETFDIILNFGKTEFSPKIAEIIANTEFEDVISEGVKILKTFGKLELIGKEEILNKIKNQNLKALTESYFA